MRRIALVGPTAAGKTAVGSALAEKMDAESVSADAMQVYRRLDIGTAKPTPGERARVPFHLLDVVDPDSEWTLADYQVGAERACSEIAGRGRIPLVVGGTGLYVRALTTRLDIPTVPPDADARARWRHIAEERGNLILHEELARVDSAAAARIHVNDVKRIVRALEVYAATGVSLSEWHRENQKKTQPDDVLLVGLGFTDRDELYRRIDARVDQMLADGFLDEVRGLLAAGYGRDLKPMQSLGYRHLAAYLAGEWDYETAIAMTKRDTRHYARRQLIWFRGDTRVHWLEAQGKTPERLADEIAALVDEYAPADGEGARE